MDHLELQKDICIGVISGLFRQWCNRIRGIVFIPAISIRPFIMEALILTRCTERARDAPASLENILVNMRARQHWIIYELQTSIENMTCHIQYALCPTQFIEAAYQVLEISRETCYTATIVPLSGD